MSEELKVIIKAEISQFKKGIDEAKKSMGSFSDQVKKQAKTANDNIKKMSQSIKEVGKTIGKSILAGTVAAGAAVVGLGKKALDCYGDYEQLTGGIETLFKDSAGTVMAYARDAYKNQQMSANQYMEIATSFSASLLQGLNGDTAEAARIADMAITDMADNANKMGSSMESIQNAYQGFAKQNYTMLDNLKLGYGGTKEEMERLLADAEKLSGIHYDIGNLNDVYEAIHVVQVEMGIAGTSAQEAASTIQGSVAMMKSAWTNWVTGLMDDNANISQLTQNLIGSVKQVIENVLPRVKEFFASLVQSIHDALAEYPAAQAVFDKVVEALKTIKKIVSDVINFVVKNWATIKPILTGVAVAVGVITTAVIAYNAVQAVKIAMEAAEVTTLGALVAAQMASAAATLVALAPYILIVAAIAAVIAIIVVCIKHWDDIKAKVSEVWENIKSTVQAGVDAVVNFFKGLWDGLKKIWDGICNVISVAFQVIKEIIGAALQILISPWLFIWKNFGDELTAAWEKIKGIVKNALDAIKNVIENIWNAIKSFLEPILEGIANTFSNVWNAIKDTTSTVFNTIKNFISNVWNGIKSTITTIITNIKNTVSNVFNTVKTAIETPLNAAKNTVMNIFNNIKSGITDKINAAKNAVKSAIDRIKSFFNFSWSLPKLKMPHISISGHFSLNPPSVPHFSIQWYKRGGVFDKTTLFQYGNGQLGGLGENGAEAVVPLENNTEWLDKIADKLADKIGTSGPIIMQVDGKTFAEISVDSINALTRQRGGLALNLV